MDKKTAIVTGASSGIGLAIARRLRSDGYAVMAAGRDAGRMQTLEAELSDSRIWVGDLRSSAACEALVAECVEAFGRLDVLVNNAGGAPAADAATASPRFSESIIALNLTSALHFAQKANAVMQQQDEGGSIISIASVSAIGSLKLPTTCERRSAGLVST